MPKRENLSAVRFGLLTAATPASSTKWNCLCDCGNSVEVLTYNLKNGNTKSCGCRKYSGLLPKQPSNLTGRRFSRLLVISKGALPGTWICLCDCGVRKQIKGSDLQSGTKSCGCMYWEGIRKSKNKKHGLNGTPEYVAYYSMLTRCYNINDPSYSYYGARGIKVCDRWLGKSGFINFFSDMGKKPAPELSLDREENNGNYEPRNCRWATKREQVQNRRSWKNG